MASILQEVFSPWIQTGILVGVTGLLLAAFRGLGSDLKSGIRAGEAKREKQMDELKKAKESLAEKVDPLPDAFRAAKAGPPGLSGAGAVGRCPCLLQSTPRLQAPP